MAEPTIRRKFQLTEFGDNHNKWWLIEAWDTNDGTSHSGRSGLYQVKASWGRVGEGTQHKEYGVKTMRWIESKCSEKARKGYTEIKLHIPNSNPKVAQASSIGSDPLVDKLLQDIFFEAGENIKSYLSVGVDALSWEQIAMGRQHLEAIRQFYNNTPMPHADANEKRLRELVMYFYNIIPTNLPRNMRDEDVQYDIVRDFVTDFHKQEERLDQLQAALDTYQSTAEGSSQYDSLGAHFEYLPIKSPEGANLSEWIYQGNVHGLRLNITGMYKVTIPSERRSFESNTFGSHYMKRLTHGTRSANVRHILREHGRGSGLHVPTFAANGWAFGPGIYFADQSSKSINYCSGQRQRFLLIADVAVGNQYIAPRSHHWTEAPKGFHSVWGKAGETDYLRYNEYIVYKQEQQTITHIVTLD